MRIASCTPCWYACCAAGAGASTPAEPPDAAAEPGAWPPWLERAPEVALALGVAGAGASTRAGADAGTCWRCLRRAISSGVGGPVSPKLCVCHDGMRSLPCARSSCCKANNSSYFAFLRRPPRALACAPGSRPLVGGGLPLGAAIDAAKGQGHRSRGRTGQRPPVLSPALWQPGPRLPLQRQADVRQCSTHGGTRDSSTCGGAGKAAQITGISDTA